MRLAFMGTPEFSVPVLSELIAAGHDVAAVYTRAPKPSGRGHKLTPSRNRRRMPRNRAYALPLTYLQGSTGARLTGP